MRIGAVVRSLREARGLNQTELAARAGIKQSYLSRVEGAGGGRARVDVLALDRIAQALEVTVDEILVMAGVRPSKDRKADLRWQKMERVFLDLSEERQEEILAIAAVLSSMSERIEFPTIGETAGSDEDCRQEEG